MTLHPLRIIPLDQIVHSFPINHAVSRQHARNVLWQFFDPKQRTLEIIDDQLNAMVGQRMLLHDKDADTFERPCPGSVVQLTRFDERGQHYTQSLSEAQDQLISPEIIKTPEVTTTMAWIMMPDASIIEVPRDQVDQYIADWKARRKASDPREQQIDYLQKQLDELKQ